MVIIKNLNRFAGVFFEKTNAGASYTKLAPA